MAQPAGDQFRLDASIRRLSLAPTTQRAKVSSRNASGPTISGRPYDQLPPGAAPPAWSPESTRHATPVAAFRPPVVANEPKDLPTIPRSELPHRRRSSRTPIHPALASPPRERLTNGHVRQQSLGQPVPTKPNRQSFTAPPKPPSTFPRQNPIAPSMNSPPGPSRNQPSMERGGMSEASAYALAVAPNLVRSTSKSHPAQSKTPRPLPRPPSVTQPSGQRSASGPVQQPMFDFEFARSPTLPDLTDPRNDSKPIGSPAVKNIQRKDPTNLPQIVTQQVSPYVPPQLASPQRVSPQKVKAKPPPRPIPTRRGPACFRALSLASVQAALLPYLSINSFLSLTGSSERLRKCFTGEVVGRWVVKSWGIQLGREKGRSWPNLTVWEGFLESLLHDPATYSTYSAQWHSLLSHLCLSHTLIVLHLRSLPPSSFPASSPFDEEGIKHSSSFTSLVSLQRPHSRVSSAIGSDYSALQRPPKQERLVEIIMPEPLAAKAPTEAEIEVGPNKLRRRGSIGSMTSGISFMGRKRSNSEVIPAPGKTGLPPVSYPTPKRYGFRGTSSTSRSSFDGGRPGSLRPGSMYSAARQGSMYSAARPGSVYSAATGFSPRRPPMPLMENLIAPPRGWHRKSMSSSEASRPRSEWGGSPNLWSGSPNPERREGKIEPAFDQQPPYSPGRAPILRVYIPLSDKVRRWPSAEAAAATVRELDKCGATRKLRLGDLIVNTAIHQPKTTEHVLIFVPFLKHLLVPLEYKFMPTGHLPSYIDAFQLPPSYYYPFLPAPQVVFLNLTAFAERALKSVRLAYDRRDVTTASGARLSAKRYLHVAGFDIVESDHPCPEWRGMISLEAEGTLEGKAELERQFMAQRALSGPWEIVREKSMSGSVWLRLRKE